MTEVSQSKTSSHSSHTCTYNYTYTVISNLRLRIVCMQACFQMLVTTILFCTVGGHDLIRGPFEVYLCALVVFCYLDVAHLLMHNDKKRFSRIHGRN